MWCSHLLASIFTDVLESVWSILVHGTVHESICDFEISFCNVKIFVTPTRYITLKHSHVIKKYLTNMNSAPAEFQIVAIT